MITGTQEFYKENSMIENTNNYDNRNVNITKI